MRVPPLDAVEHGRGEAKAGKSARQDRGELRVSRFGIERGQRGWQADRVYGYLGRPSSTLSVLCSSVGHHTPFYLLPRVGAGARGGHLVCGIPVEPSAS